MRLLSLGLSGAQAKVKEVNAMLGRRKDKCIEKLHRLLAEVAKYLFLHGFMKSHLDVFLNHFFSVYSSAFKSSCDSHP
jgi:hypothetical protein